jgi:hypothetical protein
LPRALVDTACGAVNPRRRFDQRQTSNDTLDAARAARDALTALHFGDIGIRETR